MLNFEDYLNNLQYGGNVKVDESMGPHQYCPQCGEMHKGKNSRKERKLCDNCKSTLNTNEPKGE